MCPSELLFLAGCLLSSLPFAIAEVTDDTVEVHPFVIHHRNRVTETSEMTIDNDANVVAYKFPSTNECLVLLNSTENPREEGEQKDFDVTDTDPAMDVNILGDLISKFCSGLRILFLKTKPIPPTIGRISKRSNGRGCGIRYNRGIYNGYPYPYDPYLDYGGPFGYGGGVFGPNGFF